MRRALPRLSTYSLVRYEPPNRNTSKKLLYDSASVDNLRLWNVAESVEQDSMSRAKGVQFKIIPGHHGGYVSQMSTCAKP